MAKTRAKKAAESKPTLDEMLTNFRKDFDLINEPTILYKIGDIVQHGHVTKSTITEIYDDGKILLLHQVVTEHNYGNSYDHERDMFVAWHDVTPILKTKPKLESIPYEKLSFSQRDVDGLLHKVYSFGVDFKPDYQRDLVWEIPDKVALIESIFNYVDIGKFVFARRPYGRVGPGYEIIDGKQRLTTLIEYYEGRFSWRGKTFQELHPTDQYFFSSYPVSTAELEEPSRERILDCFIRLNTGGKPQDPAHIEKVKKLLETK